MSAGLPSGWSPWALTAGSSCLPAALEATVPESTSVAVWPAASDGTTQRATPSVIVQVPSTPVSCTVAPLSAPGTAWVMTTLVASDGPLLATARV